MTLRAIGSKVIVRPDAPPEQSEGGILIPQTVNRDNPNYFPMTGTVLSSALPEFKEGDRIVFGRYAGKQVTWERDTLLVLTHTEDSPEILGFADGYVHQGYQAPKWGKASPRVDPIVHAREFR